MTKVRVTAFLLLFAAGCGSGVGGVGSPSQRSARATCREQGMPDYFIDLLFTAYRIAQDEGYTASQVLEGVREGCAVGDEFGGGCINNPNVGVSITMEECNAQCISCIAAVVGEVYGIR